jgi:hypothetical protein
MVKFNSHAVSTFEDNKNGDLEKNGNLPKVIQSNTSPADGARMQAS